MRIIGGSFKGASLTPVGDGDKAASLRPTSDRVRESIFNLLMNAGYDEPILDAGVLDLFAGTGALGFEALSRGASSVLFVDNGVAARALIRKNIDLLNVVGKTKLFKRDATDLGMLVGNPYNLVFLDPPYGKGMGEKALLACQQGGWLSQDALIVWEESAQKVAPLGYQMYDSRKYGDTWIHILGVKPKSI